MKLVCPPKDLWTAFLEGVDDSPDEEGLGWEDFFVIVYESERW